MLRLVQIAPHNPDAPASGFVEFMEAGPERTVTEEDMRKAVEEIDRRGELLREKHAQLVAAGVEIETLKKRVGELEAAAAKPATVEQQRLTDDGNPHGEPKIVALPPGVTLETAQKVMDATNAPVEAKAKPPAVGPSKPPELKAGKK